MTQNILILFLLFILTSSNDENMQQLEPFKIIGISIETTNENGKSLKDMGKLWERFYSEDISGQISNKVNEDIYSIYTDYERDYTGKYTSIIGVKVKSLEEIPEGMIGREFEGGTYQKFVAQGKMPDAVIEKWQMIWSKKDNLKRTYTADFEVYGLNSQNGENSEVEIYIATE